MNAKAAGTHTYTHPRPALTVDCVVFGVDPSDLKVLLVRRGQPPFEGAWALPGGFVHMDESIDAAARRELEEETGLADIYLEQLYTFGAVGRDPRARVVSVAHFALVALLDYKVAPATDAADAAWFPVADPPSLAFDHDEILAVAHERLRGKVRYAPIGFELLPELFPLSALQHVYEVILEEKLDKRNFRRKVLATGLVLETDEVQRDVSHRAARLYRFDRERYLQLEADGFNFEV